MATENHFVDSINNVKHVVISGSGDRSDLGIANFLNSLYDYQRCSK